VEFLRKFLIKNIQKEQNAQELLKGISSPKPVRRLYGYSWLVIALGVVLIVGMWLFIWQQINHDYERTMADTSLETMNLATAFEEHVRRIVAGADKDMINLEQAYERDGISSPVFSVYAQNASKDPSRHLVAVYNEHGDVVASFVQNFLASNRSDRDYFQRHRVADGQNVIIGMPITGRVTGQVIIPLTRRINKPDGSFGGIVLIGLKADYFTSFYKKIDLGQEQLISLTGMDGFVRARQVGANCVFREHPDTHYGSIRTA